MRRPGGRCRSPSSRPSRWPPARCRCAWHSSMKAASAGSLSAAAARRADGPARCAMKLRAEQRVGPRRVDLELVSPAGGVAGRARSAPAGPPSGRSSCAASGAPSRASGRARRARRAGPPRKSVILKNHWVSSRCSTERAGAPAAAVDHLLVGEHGLVDRVPVDLGGLAVDEARGRGSRGTCAAGGGNSLGSQVAISRLQSSDRPIDFSCARMVAMLS